jgi:hypothetical protein
MKKPSVFTVIRVGAYLLLFGNMIISYYHALDLERDLVRLPGELLPHVWVVSLDLVFVLSVIVLSQTGGRGFLPWLFFLLGLTFTGWSNIRESVLRGDVEGTIVNGGTVVALLILELLLRWMEKKREMFEEADTRSDIGQQTGHSDKLPDIFGQVGKFFGQSDNVPDTNSDNRSDTAEDSDTNRQTAGRADTLTDSSDIRSDSASDIAKNNTHKKTTLSGVTDEPDTSEKSQTDIASDTRTGSKYGKIPETASDSRTDSDKNRTTDSDNRTDSESGQTDRQTAKRTPKRSDTRRTNSDTKSDSQRTESDSKSDSRTSNVSEHPVAVAKRMRDELGDWPSIRKLAQEAGITRHQADKTLKMLKGESKAS